MSPRARSVAHQAITEHLKCGKPTKPEEFSTPPYRCPNSSFGAYLLAANVLRYIGAQLSATSRRDVEFLFYDPDERGPGLLRRFNSGAVGPVNPRILLEVRGFLVSEARRVQMPVGVKSEKL